MRDSSISIPSFSSLFPVPCSLLNLQDGGYRREAMSLKSVFLPLAHLSDVDTPEPAYLTGFNTNGRPIDMAMSDASGDRIISL